MVGKKKTKVSSGNKLALGLAAAATIGTSAIVIKNLPYFVGEYVVSVIDGDSFKISHDQTIRLASLNAPEMGYCYGQQAKEALKKLIDGKRVVLRQPQTDRYGRIMALVYVDRVFVNGYMIKNGFAASTRQAGFESDTVTAANEYAREHKIGIFSSLCTQTDPPDPKCPVKGNIDDRSKAKEYLTPACPDYSKTIIERHFQEQWFCSEAAARAAGFTKSTSCLRKGSNNP